MFTPQPSTIFLTGTTGFLGKVVLEELIRRREDYHLQKIIVLLRPSNTLCAQDRFYSEVASSPCFSMLHSQWQEKVEVVQGDLTQTNCGLSPETLQRICREVTHIINCAACVAFDLPLANAAIANVGSALNLMSLARSCFNLLAMVTTSTSYVAPFTESPIPATLAPLPYSPAALYQDILDGKIDEATILKQTHYPNTYTLTKCLAEHIYLSQKDLPLTIVRPSIISCAWRYPCPGWIDSKAAVAGFVALMGMGYLRVVDGKNESILDVVPVDVVANDIIREVQLISFHQSRWSDTSSGDTIVSPSCCSIVHSVAGVKRGLKIEMLASTVTRYFERIHRAQAPGKSRRPCLKYLGQRNIIFYMHDFMAQRLPLCLTSLYFHATRNPKMARKTQSLSRVLQKMNTLFPYYTNRTFDFEPSVWFLDANPLAYGLEKEDSFTPEKYAVRICEGVREHLLRI
ncbi:hypothetical protein LTR84_000358 [Exophiala bonariae]|uniref:Fatty acyl-CoA reductase n=1 Tax=Exophiala bonariae TaxID=1690606 RepID=A0AAV9NQU6_9EURO|nr:hypothetical protein LTR84_000358 [Exophiala bonariae]